MAPNLQSGQFKIVSLATEDNLAASVNLTLPAVQPVVLGGPVQTWTVKKDDNPDSSGSVRVRLSVGGYTYTGVDDNNKVIASVNSEDEVVWKAAYAELHDAYVIARGDDEGRGWAVNNDGETNWIDVRPIIIGPAEPPFYPPMYLFRFVPYDSE